MINICLFSGGTGNDRFVQLLKNIPNVSLDIIINGYDDGKSTKNIREYADGMLGPSDFRKNLSHLISSKNTNGKILQNILNFRFPKNISQNEFVSFLKLKKNNSLVNNLDLYGLSYESFLKLEEYLAIFLSIYIKKKTLKISDISLGNILVFVLFIKNKKSFNRSLKEMHKFLNIKKNNVLNITNGENLYLYAILTNGKIIEDEETLVNIKQKYPIENIFLLKNKISKNILDKLNDNNKEQKILYFNKHNRIPSINPETKDKLSRADIIIYGPGTQYSSLFPSYLTNDLCKTIEKSKAKKFLITNIFLDNDIINENVESIIDKFFYFFNKSKNKNYKSLKNKLVDYYLINKFDEDDQNLLKKNNYLIFNKKKNFTLLDWEKSEGLHYPNKLAKEIFSLANKKTIIKSLPKSVLSIVIPCLNEKKTIGKVLNKIKEFKIKNFDLIIDVIVVDGGSIDGSDNIIRKFKEFKFYSLKNAGKGDAIKLGISKSKGDIIAFFPSDDEYNVEDIEKVITPIMYQQSKAVYGSRMIKVNILENELRKIYKNNTTSLLLSKYGGKIINIFILALYNTSISDPFTSIKAFDAKLLKSLSLHRKGFDLEFEILTKLKEKNCYFLEVPVLFYPRTSKQGKKITVFEGLKCLFYIIFSKFL
jgi:2-phospho-L-lactate transferase/gluconeogenesis factor (CofD/UPF0052 family)